jgi:N-acetylglutamate synthase-like GNAT family acetyltransferase
MCSLSLLDTHFPCYAVDLGHLGGGAKLVDHVVNALIDLTVENIFLMGTYEERYFHDYCHKKSIQSGKLVK